MSIFTTRKMEYVAENSVPVIEGYDFETDGYIDAFMESFDDDLAVMEAMHKYDMLSMLFESSKKDDEDDDEDEEKDDEDDDEECAKEATGVPEGNWLEGDADVSDSLTDMYNKTISGSSSVQSTLENAFKDIGKKILDGLQKLWAKIKSYFNTAKMYFDRFTKSGKEFVTKYGPQLKDLKNLGGFKYKMYPYNNNAIDGLDVKTLDISNMKEIVNSMEEISTMPDEKYKSLKSDLQDMTDEKNVKSDILKKWFASISYSETDSVGDIVKKQLRGGVDGEPKEIPVDINSIISILSNGTSKKKIAKMSDDINKEFDNMMSITKRAISGIEKDAVDSERMSTVNRIVGYFKMAKNISLQGVSALKNIYVERDTAYKKACLAAMSYSKKGNK